MRFLQEFEWLTESMKFVFALTSRRHEIHRNRDSKASRRVKFVSNYCSKNCEFDRNRNSKANRRSNSLFKQLIARLIWYQMKYWSNTIYENDQISQRSTDWLRLKRVNRQSDSFFVIVCYRLLICAFTDQCWFISTMMIRFNSSILCVYWLRRVRDFIAIWCVVYIDAWVTWFTLI
jgi:hypothetical protein